MIILLIIILLFISYYFNLSLGNTLLLIFLTCFLCWIALGTIEDIEKSRSEPNNLKSFLKNFSLNILGIILLIGGVYLIFKIVISVSSAVVFNLPPWILLALIPMAIIGSIFGFDKKSPEDKKKFLDEWDKVSKQSEEREKEQERKKLEYEIEELKRERDSIATYNGFFGGSGLTESEIQYNRRRKQELTRQIDSLEYDLRNKF